MNTIYQKGLEDFVSLNEEYNKCINDYEQLEKTNINYKNKIKEYETNINQKDNEIIGYKSKIKEYETNFKEKDNEIIIYKNKIKEQGKNIKEKDNEIINYKNKIKEYETNINQKDNEIIGYKNKIKEQETNIKEKENNTNKSQSKINKINEKKSNDNNKTNYNDLLGEIYKILPQKKKTPKEFENLNLQEKFTETKEKIEKLINIKSDLEEKLKVLKGQIENMKMNEEKFKIIVKVLAKEELSLFKQNKNNENDIYLIKKKKIAEFYEKKSENNALNYISLNISSIDDLIEKGWKITKNYKEDFKEELIDENRKGLIIGFLGDNYEGKTYYINKIFKCNLSLEPTNNINYYYINKNIRIIDIPGTNKIILPKMNNDLRDTIFGYQKDKLLQDEILETKKKDFIIQKFIIDNSIINIMIISSFNLELKKE